METGNVNAQSKCAAALGSFYQLTGELRKSIMWYGTVIINLRMKTGEIPTLKASH